MIITIQKVIDRIGIIYEDLNINNLINIYNIIYPLEQIKYIRYGLFMKVNK